MAGCLSVCPHISCQWFTMSLFIFSKYIKTQFHSPPISLQTMLSMSIKKSQGHTFKVVGIDLSVPCFTHIQLYMAISRNCSISKSDAHSLTMEGYLVLIHRS